jgi:hypothetical protein
LQHGEKPLFQPVFECKQDKVTIGDCGVRQQRLIGKVPGRNGEGQQRLSWNEIAV